MHWRQFQHASAHTHFHSIHTNQIFPRRQLRAWRLSACKNTRLVCALDAHVQKSNIWENIGLVMRKKKKQKTTPKKRSRPPIPCTITTTLPIWVNTTWVRETTLHFFLGHCHRRSKWFNSFLTQDSHGQCQPALLRRLSIHQHHT